MSADNYIAWLSERLSTRLAPPAYEWFGDQISLLRQDGDDMLFLQALGLAARRVGKAGMAWSQDELAAAGQMRAGFDPLDWSVDQAARVALILARYVQNPDLFPARLERFAESAELNELIALYRGFALYPPCAALEPRAREAVRSSMRPVYEALAHRNPFPLEMFDQAAWNQMVVKSFFVDSPLWPVQGIEQRLNMDLCNILVDLAHERWAAERSVSPELWRCVAPFADAPQAGAAVQHALTHGSDAEHTAIYWSLRANSPLLALCRTQGEASHPDWNNLLSS